MSDVLKSLLVDIARSPATGGSIWGTAVYRYNAELNGIELVGPSGNVSAFIPRNAVICMFGLLPDVDARAEPDDLLAALIECADQIENGAVGMGAVHAANRARAAIAKATGSPS